ncbi:glycosyltransferase family 4 protein [Bacillus sp. sid0103]|uniref:glycosyltransferase family 4 protein n=1 Tax=Bacillus sp. sid0103 TaxID=2856337 RepID=UPI001C48CB7B|nr:glycosyltransferase family 4 protein [Bacillus sp. sid0103]MBV7504120.1 glycosyltransferase family 4 protein [Bacillus sp. sid0103]
MKILYVITGADIGGAQNHLLYLSEWFSGQGHDVHVVLGEDGPLNQELTKRNIKTTIIPIPRTIKVAKDLRALWKTFLFIKKGNYDIVHSHSSKAGIIARLAGFLNRVNKNIYTAHGFVFTDPTLSAKKKAFYLFLEKAFSLVSTDIITVSHFDFQQGKAHGITERKMTVIHNGIPASIILSGVEWEKKQKRLDKSKKQIIGFVGRFSSEKNIDMLMRVASLFKEANHDQVEFWLLGDGPLFEHIQAEIKNRSLQSLIHLKGMQNDVYDWMDKMHAMVITSHKEGLPYVLLEACGRGLPVISTDVGGVKEILDPQDNKDIIVRINDDEAMYRQLVSILSSYCRREELGNYLLNLAGTLTVEHMCLRTIKIYKS